MKKFEIYRNIRKSALIFGLPISSFALMMISVIGSLLAIIFSFGFIIILSLVFWNILFYAILIYLVSRPNLTLQHEPFPPSISNKKIGLSSYEEN
ncbi:MAG: hypothetical protein CML04_00520 [Pseudozobellia sp.]|nr:hypothetical protein [Pseudozobellia sp.]MBG48042.1 hypothetical protein [Pseudozobellia sp.]